MKSLLGGWEVFYFLPQKGKIKAKEDWSDEER
jgi:hypothetical protein